MRNLIQIGWLFFVATSFGAGTSDELCRRKISAQATSETVVSSTAETLVDVSLPKLKSHLHLVARVGKRPQSADPVFVFLPGGPGLSSQTMRSLEELKRSADLVFVDPPGTGGHGPADFTQFRSRDAFWEVLRSIEVELAKLNRPLILVGHSFGGFYAGSIALRDSLNGLDIRGVVFIATALRKNTFNTIMPERIRLYEKAQSGQHGFSPLAHARMHYMNEPSAANYAEWVANYGLLIFSEESLSQGRRLILGDPQHGKPADQVCPRSSAHVRMNWEERQRNFSRRARWITPEFLSQFDLDPTEGDTFSRLLKQWPGRKAAVVGSADILLSVHELGDDALASGVAREDIILVPRGSHFPFLEGADLIIDGLEERFLRRPHFTPPRLPR